jgi:hypothetical protein
MDTKTDSPQSSPKKLAEKIRQWFNNHSIQIIYIRDFAFVVIIYGLLISYVLSTLFDYKFNLKIILALGIAFYFIKEELPKIISKSLPKNPKNRI